MMVQCLDSNGKHVDVDTIEFTAEGARRFIAALTSSSSTHPYSTVKLPRCGVKSVRVVTSRSAKPKSAHTPIPGACLGTEPEEPVT